MPWEARNCALPKRHWPLSLVGAWALIWSCGQRPSLFMERMSKGAASLVNLLTGPALHLCCRVANGAGRGSWGRRGRAAHTKAGSTPLHYAAGCGQSQVLETLVKVGYQPGNGAPGALSMVLWLVVSAGSCNMFGRGGPQTSQCCVIVCLERLCIAAAHHLSVTSARLSLATLVAADLQSRLIFLKNLALELLPLSAQKTATLKNGTL